MGYHLLTYLAENKTLWTLSSNLVGNYYHPSAVPNIMWLNCQISNIDGGISLSFRVENLLLEDTFGVILASSLVSPFALPKILAYQKK